MKTINYYPPKEKRKEKKEKELQKNRWKRLTTNHSEWVEAWADLPDKVFNARTHFWLPPREGGITKIWKAAPRGSISAQKSPYWLVLPHHEMINTVKPFISESDCYYYQLYFDNSPLGFKIRGWKYKNTHQRIEGDFTFVGSNSWMSDKNYKFTNAIAFRGRIYVLSLQGTLGIIDVLEDPQQLRAKMSIIMSLKDVIPSATSSKGFREYLVESNGQILLVFLVFRKSVNVVDEVEVFCLLGGRNKVESLGDRILIMEDKCCWVFPPRLHSPIHKKWFSASQIGFDECSRNCIYFTNEPGGEWWVFDYGTKRLSPVKGCRF